MGESYFNSSLLLNEFARLVLFFADVHLVIDIAFAEI